MLQSVTRLIKIMLIVCFIDFVRTSQCQNYTILDRTQTEIRYIVVMLIFRRNFQLFYDVLLDLIYI